MSDNQNFTVEEIGKQATKLLGSDINSVSLEDRINITPINDVEWSGLRGQSFCKPTSPKMKNALKKYNVEGIPYSINCEPDFDKVAIAKVKISDMTQDLQHDRKSTIKKLLKTDWAKSKGLTSVPEFEAYIKKHHLTIHESPDGVTEYLIEEKIHRFFKHSGGRHKYRKFKNPDPNRIIQTRLSQGAVEIKKNIVKVEEITGETKDFISAQTGRFMSENFKQINAAGVDEAVNSAMFAAVLSTTKNTISVIKGEESTTEAIKEILYDTSSAAALGYATGAIMERFSIGERSEAALYVNGIVQISKQIISYANGNIDEKQLLCNVAETTVLIAAAKIGRTIGAVAGAALATSIMGPAGAEIGAEIGKVIGEMLTTAICSEIITAIKDSKEFKKQNAKIISLYRSAESQIRESQARLEEIIQAENNELRQVIYESFQMIVSGINNNSNEEITAGLIHMGSEFGLTEEDFIKNKVTRDNLPDKTEVWAFS